jgi:hypothetical protein
VPSYKVTVVDPSGRIPPGVSWKKYKSDVPLEYGNEIVIESDSPDGPGSVRARVTEVDNDALFTNRATVEPVQGAATPES